MSGLPYPGRRQAARAVHGAQHAVLVVPLPSVWGRLDIVQTGACPNRSPVTVVCRVTQSVGGARHCRDSCRDSHRAALPPMAAPAIAVHPVLAHGDVIRASRRAELGIRFELPADVLEGWA